MIKILQFFKFISACIKNLFFGRQNFSKIFFSSVSDIFNYMKGCDKSSLIQKLTGEQHVNVILKKTIESIIKEDIHHKDRKNARKRDVLLSRHAKRKRNVMLFLAFIGLVSCLSILGLVSELSTEMICIISTTAGIFGSCLKDAYVFEFGSRSNKEKKYFDD